jgi:hypothetical protein
MAVMLLNLEKTALLSEMERRRFFVARESPPRLRRRAVAQGTRPCGEGIYPRWVAKRPPTQATQCARKIELTDLGPLRAPAGINPLATGPCRSQNPCGYPTSPQTDLRFREQAPTGETRSHPEPGRLSGRLVADVDLGAPLTTLAERRHCGVGIPAWMPG